jgi:cytochrome d ubiquinol oxidase subunit I
LRTAESASPLAAPAVGASLAAFVIVYFSVFGMGAGTCCDYVTRAATARVRAANAPAHAAGITPASALTAKVGRCAMADTTVLNLV